MLKTKAEVMKTLGRVYKDRIELQKPAKKTPDGKGGFVTTFETVATVGAFFRKPKVSTTDKAGVEASEMVYEVAIQNRSGVPDVKKGWQIVFGTKKFDVKHAYDDDFNREKIIIYEDVVK